MAYRKPEASDFVGKTIKSIDAKAVNSLKFTFVDDTVVELYAEDAIYTPAGSIPGIFVDDKNVI